MEKILMLGLFFSLQYRVYADAVATPKTIISCKKYQVRVIVNDKFEEGSEELCVINGSDGLVSPSLKDKKDFSLNLAKKFKWDELLQTKGAPDFKLCEKIGGEGKFFDYFENEKWISTQRCYLFPKKNSSDFIEMSLLVKLLTY